MDVFVKWQITERMEASLCVMGWMRSLKISHIQGHVCLTAMTTETDDILLSDIILFCCFVPVECVHARFIIVSLIMVP